MSLPHAKSSSIINTRSRVRTELTNPEQKKRKRKQMDHASSEPDQGTMSPTAQLSLKKQQQEIQLLKQKLLSQQEVIEELSTERDLLKEQLTQQPPQPSSSVVALRGKRDKTPHMQSSSSESSSTSISSDSSFDSSSDYSSSDETTKKKKRKKKNKKKKTKIMKKHKKTDRAGEKTHNKAYRDVKRARDPDDIVERYTKVLKAFKKGLTMSGAFQKVGVDRNTIVNNAPVAELAIADQNKFSELKNCHLPNDKLSDFIKSCIEEIKVNSEIGEKIKQLKANGQLLPIGKGRF
ncbi:coiled-coil domain-containing protein 106-like [Oryzias latipes]|uniref:coiled-coil domain-containing protein 106-like n=1 Tax=Oryzias latipes TaxID=8090 RepID=UPI000CE18CCB|nr:coiled-coil domain-containing protein 106-like [Oryzias latipes]